MDKKQDYSYLIRIENKIPLRFDDSSQGQNRQLLGHIYGQSNVSKVVNLVLGQNYSVLAT